MNRVGLDPVRDNQGRSGLANNLLNTKDEDLSKMHFVQLLFYSIMRMNKFIFAFSVLNLLMNIGISFFLFFTR